MLAVCEKDIIENFSDIQDKIFNGETIIAPGKQKENLIILSEKNITRC